MELKRMDDIIKELEPITKSKLRKTFEDRTPKEDANLEGIVRLPSVSGKIYSNKIISSDTADRYAVALIETEVDEYDGKKGVSKKIDYQLVDLKEKKVVLEFGPKTYRDGDGAAGDKPEIAFTEAKILGEKEGKVAFGVRSGFLLEIDEFDGQTGNLELLERVDLSRENGIIRKKKNIEKAIKDMDPKAIRKFVEEDKYFTTVETISDDYALTMLDDPYGDTGRRHAKLKLIVRDEGVIDLGIHEKQFFGSAVTQSFDIADAKISLAEEGLVLKYSIRETESVGHSMGITTSTLGTTSYEITLGKGLPVGRDIHLNHLIDSKKEEWLNPGNLNPIPLIDEGVATYPYSIDHIRAGDKEYISVVKVIDAERFSAGILFDPQIKIEVYEVDDIGLEDPSVKLVMSETSLRGDQEGGLVLPAYKEGETLKFSRKPILKATDEGVEVSYKLKGSEDVMKKYIVKTD